MVDNNLVGKNLKILREMWGYYESAVAEYLGVTEEGLKAIESGRFIFDDIKKLCELYAVKFEDLIFKEEVPLPYIMRYYSTKDLKSIAGMHKIFYNFLEMLDIAEDIRNGD